MQHQNRIHMNNMRETQSHPGFSASDIASVLPLIREPVTIIQDVSTGRLGVCRSGEGSHLLKDSSQFRVMGSLPPLYPEWLGDRSFLEVHGLRFPYVAGAMFRGIASTTMVIAMARAGMIGFFGAAGLSINALERALDEIQTTLEGTGLPWGSNLIHSPGEPDLEEAVVDLYLKRDVQRISAAAFMTLSPNIVRYSASGLQADPSGQIHRKNHVFAKLSRPEVAHHFMTPPPKDILDFLVSKNKITRMEADLAARLPLAEDITVEADSGGHTDNRPLPALFPTILGLRNALMDRYGYVRPIRVGAAGGIGTPSAAAAAFAMGAAYVLTGSINQSAVESGLSPEGKKMLSKANVVDVTMAPAADMFELGVKVQVLKQGTMFCSRAAQLWELYSKYDSLKAIPSATRDKIEKTIFRASLDDIWSETHRFFSERNPKEVEKAEKNEKYQMALIFRWYLGNSAQWAMTGDPNRHLDYQICCGPSMGAFNSWVAGSFLEKPENRSVTNIALNILEGAAVITRAQQLRSYGVPVPESSFIFFPRPLS